MAHGDFGFISVIQLIWIFRKNHGFPWLWIWKPMNFHDYEFVSHEFSMNMNMKSHEFPWIRKNKYELYEYESRDIFNCSWSSYELYEPRIKTPSRNSILDMKSEIFHSLQFIQLMVIHSHTAHMNTEEKRMNYHEYEYEDPWISMNMNMDTMNFHDYEHDY